MNFVIFFESNSRENHPEARKDDSKTSGWAGVDIPRH